MTDLVDELVAEDGAVVLPLLGPLGDQGHYPPLPLPTCPPHPLHCQY